MRSNTAEFWVFAYGSLMWRPGFAFVESAPARLHGYHRALCIWSIRYRGTPERPGLVMGLDRGGSCVGRAYRVAPAEWPPVLEYLTAREMPTNAYEPRDLPIRLKDGRRVSAYGYVARHGHVQYAGRLSDAAAAEIVRGAAGSEGPAIEYLSNTVEQLRELGIRGGALHRVRELVLTGGR